ncbi:hypothetical protein RRG08_045855 [Elysia crispata]|uniref:Uncharacterized protein n=1 Tax=Elysia crispata TaxID=231223 RepID=A0AAE0ZEV6_9GAST|nr:hypothetical protein RRG08_045855 [Elysia crispata]
MEKETFIYFLVLLLCGTNLKQATANQGHLCQEKAAIFHNLTRHLTSVLAEKDNRNPLICAKLAGHVSHALYTKQTCPDLPLVKNSTFLNTVALMKSDFDKRCDAEQYAITVHPCSPAMVDYLVQNCNRHIDKVQFSMPRLEVCDISKDFIACHENSLIECHQTSLFDKYHIAEALQVTRDSLDFMCDESLANEPWENGPDHRRSIRSLEHPADSDCPQEIKNGASVPEFCSQEKERIFPDITLGSGYGDICRVFHFMYTCATELFEKCANSTPEKDKSYFLDHFPLVYNKYGCTFNF